MRLPWRRVGRRDPEIAPDEIFLDASNAPAFDRNRFEGRIEKPLSHNTFIYLGAALTLLFIILIGRSWHLQVTHGADYASLSAENRLAVTILFAPRGLITDMHGEPLVQNEMREDGTLWRTYLLPELGQIIGYVSRPKKDAKGIYYETDMTGVAGLEAKHDTLLSGTNGQLLTERDVLGEVRSEGMVVPAEEGKPLRLSLDAEMVRHLARAVRETAREKGFIAGAGVILDVQTGEVRSIVSYPTYDPNVMSEGTPADLIESYGKDSGRPYLDHAVQGAYTPGSIVKPFIASGALADGLITPNTVIEDKGVIKLPDPYTPGKVFLYTGWKALGPVDVKRALAWSSDIFFYTVGGGFENQRGLGIDRLAYWYRQFGFGSPTGVDLPEESKGLVPTPEWKKKVFNEPWYLGDTYFTAIGQYSVQVTPMQAARAVAAVANGGHLMTPTLIADREPLYARVSVGAAALAVVREGMRQTVTEALAQQLNLPYVTVAAKTGTAQTGTRNQYDNSWVIGFFPYEEPRYAFAVVLERGPEGSGSQAVNAMRTFFDSLHSANPAYFEDFR